MIWSSLNFGNSSKSRLKMDGSRLKLDGKRSLISPFDVLSPMPMPVDEFSPTVDDFEVSDFIVDEDEEEVPIFEKSSSKFCHIRFESSIICNR